LATLALACAAATAALVWWGTQDPGPGLYGDGAGYLGAAESLARGAGLRVPFASYAAADSTSAMAQWPPGFSIVLSGPLRAGVEPRSAVRIVQAGVGACTVALTAVLVATATAPVWGALAAVALLATPAVVAVHLNVVSEPLYLLCLAIALWAMVWRADRPLWYGLAAAAAIFVRYLGVAAIVGAGVWAAFQPGSATTRARRAAVAVIPGIIVRELWAAYMRWTGAVGRPVHLDHQVGGAARALVGATAAWLAPWDGSVVARTAFKLALGAVIVVGLAAEIRVWTDARRPGDRMTASGVGLPRARATMGAPAMQLLAASILMAACHVAALLAARLVYSDVALYDRVLSPVHYLAAVGAVVLLGSRWAVVATSMRATLAVLGTVWVVASASVTASLVRSAVTVGLDHAAVTERGSPTIRWLRTYGGAQPIYTNEPAKIYYHLHRDSRSLPWVLDADTVQALDRALRARPGVVVWFLGGTAASFVAADLLPRASTPAKLEAALPLHVRARFDDGIVWMLDPSGGNGASVGPSEAGAKSGAR
jgi:hypothetical protein